MNLRERMLALPLAERIEYDARSNVLFVNFEGLGVDSARDIDEIETDGDGAASSRSASASTSSSTTITSASGPSWWTPTRAMVDRLSERYYRRVTRYAASGFLKARLEHRGLTRRRSTR